MSSSEFSPLTISAGKVPHGLSEHDRNSEYHGVPMTAVLSVFAAIAFAFYITRIYTKIRVFRQPGWDDLVGVLMDIVCFGIASIQGPLGKHMWNITFANFIGDPFVKPAYTMQVTGTATLGLIKLSIFLFYNQVFWPLKWCQWAIIVGGSFNSVFYLTMTIVQFYFMIPRPGETMRKHFGGKLALKVTKLSIPTSSVGLAINILLFVIPLRAVIQPQMAKKRLILTFFVGILAIIGSILSLSFKIRTYGKPDLTYNLILVNFFMYVFISYSAEKDIQDTVSFISSPTSAVEMIFGVCIASTPLISRATSHHHFQFSSLVRSLSFLHLGRSS